MAEIGVKINLEEVDRSADQSFGLLPFGDYLLELTASGQYLDGNNLTQTHTYSVIEPEDYKGRFVFDRFDLQNDLEWKQKKGQARWANMCDSIGYDQVTEGVMSNDDVLYFRPFMAKVIQEAAGVSKAGKPFKESNKIERFYKTTDNDAPSGASIAEHQPKLVPKTAAPANDNKPAPAKTAAAAAPAARRPWGSK